MEAEIGRIGKLLAYGREEKTCDVEKKKGRRLNLRPHVF